MSRQKSNRELIDALTNEIGPLIDQVQERCDELGITYSFLVSAPVMNGANMARMKYGLPDEPDKTDPATLIVILTAQAYKDLMLDDPETVVLGDKSSLN